MSDSSGLLPNLSADAEAQLRASVVDIGYGRTRTMYDLILGWAAHVRKFGSELAADVATSPMAWNEHDFVAALFIRDFVETGLGLLEDNARSVVKNLVTQVDNEFLSFTRGGYLSSLVAVAGVSDEDRSWWWDRAPIAGPVLDQLDRRTS